MKLALLGCDRHVEDLARAAARRGHQIVWAWGEPAGYAAVAAWAPRLIVSPDWEELLLTDTADAVCVAGVKDSAVDGPQIALPSDEIDLRAEQLRRLAQENVPLLLAHPAHPSMLVYYELDMIRRESGCVIVPYIVTRFHPTARRMLEAVRAGELGRIEQAVLTRETSARRRETVLARFASDVDPLREVCGDLKRLSAMGPPHGGTDYASLGVQLAAEDGTAARWTIAPPDAAGELARLTLLGTDGSAELDARPRGVDLSNRG